MPAAALRLSPDPALSLLRRTEGPLMDAASLVATRIAQRQTERGYRSYLFTSPDGSPGRTTVALNVALAVAQADVRVALIEADLRAPRLGQLIGCAQEPGLTQLLNGEVALSQACLRLDDRPLLLLHAGAPTDRPELFLASPIFKEAVAELVDTVDLLLIDAPAVAPHADAHQLLGLVDQALLVVPASGTRRASLEAVITQFTPARIAGVIYNQGR